MSLQHGMLSWALEMFHCEFALHNNIMVKKLSSRMKSARDVQV